METKVIITPDMIDAARAVFEARAKTEIIREIVEKYQLDIIKKMKPIHRHTKKLITSVKNAYDMNDKDFKKYMQLCHDARLKVGLKTKSKEYCPLLIAESEQRKKERALLTSISPIIKFDIHQLFYSVEHYKEAVDITLRCLAQYINL